MAELSPLMPQPLSAIVLMARDRTQTGVAEIFRTNAVMKPHNPSMTRRKQAGQALVLAAMGLTLFILAAGLGIDMGFLRYQKRLQQSAADSAAIAGAAEIPFSGCSTGNCPGATTDSASNGFIDGTDNVTVTVYSPPNDGPHAGLAGYVEVLVTKIQPTFFVKIAGVNSATVTARAVAYLSGNFQNCMYALGTGNGGITNNGDVSAPSCGIMSNHNVRTTGGGSITAREIGAVGAASGNNHPTPKTGIVPAADPLSYLQPPATGGCLAGGAGNVNGTTPVILNPGNYCGGISIANTQNVTFNPGVYTITGGGLTFNGTGTVTGTGVTLYIGATGGTVTLHAGQTVNLTAPTTGADAGILFYQNPGNTSTATINGASGSQFEGAFYFPSADLTIAATGTAAAYTIAVAKSLTLGPSALNFPSNFASLPNGSPIKNAVLVE
jgi:Putative Flp pilus-assembly TadE/G-like